MDEKRIELQNYLQNVIENSWASITFFGEKHNELNRWIVKKEAVYQLHNNNKSAFLDNQSFITIPSQGNYVPQELTNTCWNYYVTTNSESHPQLVFPEEEDKNIYCLSNIYCEKEQFTYFYVLGSMISKIWINGELVTKNSLDYLIVPHIFIYQLKKGNNTILVEEYWQNKMKERPDKGITFVTEPIERLLDDENSRFMDNGFVDYMRTNYSIVPESGFLKERCLRFYVFDQFFDGSGKEQIKVTITTSSGEMVKELEAVTEEEIIVNFGQDTEGILRITVRNNSNKGNTSYSDVFLGDYETYTKNLIQKVEQRKDSSELLINTVKHLASMPNLEFTCFKVAFPQSLYKKIYHILFEQLLQIEQYVNSEESVDQKEIFEIFHYHAMLFEKSKVDEEFLCYGLHFPKDYEKGKSYPLFIRGDFGRANSRYPIPLDYVSENRFEDALVFDICARGDVATDYIYDYEVFEILKQVITDYHINKDRIYYVGACDSGSKGCHLAINMPSLFAAIATISTGLGTATINPNVTLQMPMNHTPDERKKWYDELTDLNYLNNLNNSNIWYLTNIEDTTDNFARNISIKSKLDVLQIWYRYDYEHLEFDQLYNSNRLLSELLKTKKDNYPKRIDFTTYYRIYNRSNWVRIEEITDFMKKCYVNAVNGNNCITLHTENVNELSLLCNKEIMNLEDSVILNINGFEKIITLPNFSKISIQINDTTEHFIRVEEMNVNDFENEYNTIGFDENRLGIKQVYLNKCVILKSDSSSARNKKEIYYNLANPLSKKIRMYKYESIRENKIEQVEEIGKTNFVCLIDANNLSDLERKILRKQNDIEINSSFISYNGTQYNGNYFAIVKINNPYNPMKKSVLFIYNSDEEREELLNLLRSFDSNPIFFSDVIVHTNGRYIPLCRP